MKKRFDSGVQMWLMEKRFDGLTRERLDKAFPKRQAKIQGASVDGRKGAMEANCESRLSSQLAGTIDR